MSPFRWLLLAIIAAAPLAASASEVQPPVPGAWSETMGAAIRLVPGEPANATTWRAGLEIKLEDGWKTYWRMPGDSGVPPLFDWSRSTNLDHVTVLWPRPAIFEDGGGTSIGYKTDVVLPLHLHPTDPKAPINLVLDIDFAVCSTMCVPASGTVALTLDGSEPPPADAALVAAHEARVPMRVAMGETGPITIEAVEVGQEAMRVVASGVPSAELFVEGPATWFVLPDHAEAGADGKLHFDIALDGVPTDVPRSGTALTLTVSADEAAVEVPFTIP